MHNYTYTTQHNNHDNMAGFHIFYCKENPIQNEESKKIIQPGKQPPRVV